jgi:hypothetical protein
MRFTIAIGLVALASVTSAPPYASAEELVCKVPTFRGAATPQGGDAEMHVVNNGKACGIRNFGSYPDTATLAYAGSITTPPKNGVAKFEAPRALYTPGVGFVGEDYFEYQANAKGPQDNPVLMKVRVRVTVSAK